MDFLNSIVDDLSEISTGIVKRTMIESAASAVANLREESPALFDLIRSFLTKEPIDVLSTLALIDNRLTPYISNKYAQKYVRLLQEQLKGDSNDGDDG